jgi:hypothetical protein
MKLNYLPMLAAFTAAQTYEDISTGYNYLKWEAPSVMQAWYTDNGHTNELYIDASALGASDIGRGLPMRIVERTQPFGFSSFLQVYYDGFTNPYQVLDYECYTGCENNRITEIGRTFSLDPTIKGKYSNYLVLELTPDFNNNDEFSIAFLPVATLADVTGTFYSEAYDAAIALNAPKDTSLGSSYAIIAESGGYADVWANFATADYILDVNGALPVW